MQRRALAVIAVIVLGLATTACKNDKNTSGSGATTSTSAAAVTTTTSTTEPSGPAATPQAAADGLYNAWTRGDTPANRDDASRYAKQPAITKIFSQPYTAGGATYTKQPCEPQGGQFICSWTYEGGAMQMTVENWPGGGFVVDSVTFIAD